MSRFRRDGVALFYEEAGVGELPMLLVHGLACAHTHLTPQLEHFSDDHRVVAVDLRGHGQSDAPQQEYTIEGFAVSPGRKTVAARLGRSGGGWGGLAHRPSLAVLCSPSKAYRPTHYTGQKAGWRVLFISMFKRTSELPRRVLRGN
jgi:pimeloyl-ACP methyl ester carboxylesterase